MEKLPDNFGQDNTSDIDKAIEQATNKIDQEIENQRAAGIPDEEISASAETNIQQIENEDEVLINAALERDVIFYDKLNKKGTEGITPPEIIKQMDDNYKKRMEEEFKLLSPEKQDLIMNILGKKSGEISEQIKEIRANPKNMSEQDLEHLHHYRDIILNRLQVYHLASGPEKKESSQTPEQQLKEQPETHKIDINPKEINSENVEDVIQKKVSELSKQPEKLDIKNQVMNLVGNAEKILYSKEYSDEDKTEALKNYGEKISSLLSIPASSIYLTELIKDNKKLDLLVDSISKIKDEEKKIDKSKVIQQAAKLFKKEEKKGKESIFQKMGGWNTVGGIAGFSLLMLLILIFLGEFKLLEKATGIDLEGGKGGKK